MDSLWRFMPNFPAALRRYPVSIVMLLVAAGLLIALAGMADRAMTRGGAEPPLALYIAVFALAAIFWSLAVELYGEAHSWSRAARVAVAIAGSLLPIGLYFLPEIAPVFSAHWLPSFPPLLTGGALCLALAATATGTRGRDANTRIMLAILGTMAALLIAFIAVKVIKIPLEGLRFRSRLSPSGAAWVVLAGLALLLGWLAARSPAAAETGSEPGLAARLEEKMLPIVLTVIFVLLVGLAASFFRPLLSYGRFPISRGMPNVVPQLAFILLALSVTYLYVYPLRGSGGWLARGFSKAWPWLAAVLIALVVVGLFFEIQAAADGIDVRPISVTAAMGGQMIVPTVSRWLFGAFAIFIAVIAMVRPAWRDLRLPLVTLGLGLLFFAVGPWSAARLTSWRLADQLEQLVSDRGFMAGGKLAPAADAKWTDQDARLIRRISEGLTVFRSQGVLEPLFRGTPDATPFGGPPQSQVKLSQGIIARLGATQKVYHQPVTQRHTRIGMGVDYRRPIALPSSGHDTMIQFNFSTSAQGDVAINIGAEKQPAPDGNAIDLKAAVSADGELTVRFKAADAVARFDLRPLLEALIEHEKKRREIMQRNAKPGSTPEPVPGLIAGPRTIASAPGGLSAGLVVVRLSGDETDGKARIRRALAWLFVNRADIEKKP